LYEICVFRGEFDQFFVGLVVKWNKFKKIYIGKSELVSDPDAKPDPDDCTSSRSAAEAGVLDEPDLASTKGCCPKCEASWFHRSTRLTLLALNGQQ
jgi:hypothetical protein